VSGHDAPSRPIESGNGQVDPRTPQAARKLGRWGFEALGLRTWTEETLAKETETLTVRALPAIHARGLMGTLLPPVMGSMIEHRVDGVTRMRLYVSGDTLTGDHISEIARREPDIDVAVMHLGGTRVLLHTVTMDADQRAFSRGCGLIRQCPCTTTTTVSSGNPLPTSSARAASPASTTW
jgi:hypothetical protein